MQREQHNQHHTSPKKPQPCPCPDAQRAALLCQSSPPSENVFFFLFFLILPSTSYTWKRNLSLSVSLPCTSRLRALSSSSRLMVPLPSESKSAKSRSAKKDCGEEKCSGWLRDALRGPNPAAANKALAASSANCPANAHGDGPKAGGRNGGSFLQGGGGTVTSPGMRRLRCGVLGGHICCSSRVLGGPSLSIPHHTMSFAVQFLSLLTEGSASLHTAGHSPPSP